MSGNYVDIETGETYWISGVKKNGADRHWAGSGPILVEQEAVAEYSLIRGMNELDSKYYVVTDSIIQTDIDRIKKIENPNKWDFDAEENTP